MILLSRIDVTPSNVDLVSMEPVSKLFALHHLPSGKITENLLRDNANFLQVTFKNKTVVYCLDKHKTALVDGQKISENITVYEQHGTDKLYDP